jgi:hypothetical protein
MPGGNENRIRVVFNLPMNGDRQENAVNHVIEYLKQQRSKKIGIDGFTHSEIYPPVFQGYWWDTEPPLSDDSPKLVEDNLVLFVVDYLKPNAQIHFNLFGEIQKLKSEIAAIYGRFADAEQEVWVVSFGIARQR